MSFCAFGLQFSISCEVFVIHLRRRLLMRTLLVGILLSLVAINISAQTTPNEPPQDTPFAIVQRNANANVWQRTTYEQMPSGEWIPHIETYQEIATGLNFKNPETGEWEASNEEIEIVQGGRPQNTGSIR